jgi:hypothetical protein
MGIDGREGGGGHGYVDGDGVGRTRRVSRGTMLDDGPIPSVIPLGP